MAWDWLTGECGLVLVLNFLVLVLLIGWLIGWRIPLGQRVTQQQLIWLGIVAGISELSRQFGSSGLVDIDGCRLVDFYPPGPASQCTNGAPVCRLVGPLAAFWRWLGRQVLPPERAGRRFEKFATGSVEIDLSNKDKHKQK